MLLLVVFVYALTFALVVAFPLPAYQQGIAISVVSVFVLCDLFLFGLQHQVRQGTARRSILCAYYCTAFAVATLGCMAGCLVDWRLNGIPEFEFAEETPTSLFDVIGQGLATSAAILLILLCYVAVFVVFSSIGFVASLFSVRRSWNGRWLLLANMPGTAIGLLSLGYWAYCSLVGCE